MTGTTPRPWRLLSRRLVFDGSPWVRNWVESVEIPGGPRTDDFHTIELRDFAIVLPLTDDNMVVGEWTYRHGVGEVCFALPAGYIEAREDAADAARRELREETGFVATGWRSLGSFVVDGNRGCGRMSAFLATGAHLVGEPELDPMEQITPALIPLSDVERMLRDGEIKTLSSAAVLALGLAALDGVKTGS